MSQKTFPTKPCPKCALPIPIDWTERNCPHCWFAVPLKNIALNLIDRKATR